MATDNTQPRIKLIITIGAITAVTLFALNLVFTSYYSIMTDEATRSKLAPTTEKYEQRKAEQAALTAANIDQAMGALSKGTRASTITPEQSTDIGPMVGWAKMPKPAPAAPPGAPKPAMDLVGDAGAAPMMAADAGGVVAKDGGPSITTGDAGTMAPKK